MRNLPIQSFSTCVSPSSLYLPQAWWWNIQEDIRAAQEVDFGKLQTGVLHGIEKNQVYKLRVLGYASGGYGKKSTEVYFTLGGRVTIDPVTTLIRNEGRGVRAGGLLVWMLLCLSWIRNGY